MEHWLYTELVPLAAQNHMSVNGHSDVEINTAETRRSFDVSDKNRVTPYILPALSGLFYFVRPETASVDSARQYITIIA